LSFGEKRQPVGEGETDTFTINNFEVNLIREGNRGSESPPRDKLTSFAK